MGQNSQVEKALKEWLKQNNKTNEVYKNRLFARSQFYDAKQELEEIKGIITDLKTKKQDTLKELWKEHNQPIDEAKKRHIKERIDGFRQRYDERIDHLNGSKKVAEEIYDRQNKILEEAEAEFKRENAERDRLHKIFEEEKERQRKNTP